METDIRYISGNEELLDSIKCLWEELNKVHLAKSPYFKESFARNTFDARKGALLASAQKGRLHVILAYDNSLLVGYCVSSILEEAGEIDSIYVSDDYRNRGIASSLMEKSLAWLNQNNSKKTVIKVAVGNEEVLSFYAKHGFYPRLTELYTLPE
jgi:ribosomal protein S18 acetylase RimI-like enzyme